MATIGNREGIVAPPFRKLWLSERFNRSLQQYLEGKPRRAGAVFRVLDGFLTDPATLQRSPIHNPRHKLYHTRVSRGDRLIDLPLGGHASAETLVLNIGDHSVNDWAEGYSGNPRDELGRSTAYAPPLSDGSGGEAERGKTNRRAASSPWRRASAHPGTYGEYLTSADLAYHHVAEELIPVVLNTDTRVPLENVGLDRELADLLQTLYIQRLPAAPVPVPLPGLGPPPALPLTREQLPALLRMPLAKFLSQVSDEQRRLIERPGLGLMVVKGAVGTGKTVVGVRRIEHLLMTQLSPRILFLCFNQVLRDTVYQMLQDVLGNRPEDLKVTVQTAYQWMGDLGQRCGVHPGARMVDRNELKQLVAEIRRGTPAPTARIAGLPDEYVLSEIAEVIYGRAIQDEETYADPRQTDRSGRVIPISPEERRYIWQVHRALEKQAADRGEMLWEALPAHLLRALPERSGDWPLYDAVVVDEAQDLLPAVFRLLIRVQGGRDHGFVVLGDAAQNVYRASFRWADTGLRVTGGHVTVLRRCYRTTRQIIEAAAPLLNGVRARLAEDLVEPEAADREGPVPDVVLVDSEEQEAAFVARRVFELIEQGVAPSSIAVFANSRAALGRLSAELEATGVPCEPYEKERGGGRVEKSINIFEPTVKLLTVYSAKGIEFPFVFICGVTEPRYPSRGLDVEKVERARRVLYTAMMRAAFHVTLTAVAASRSGLLDEVQSHLRRSSSDTAGSAAG